MDLALMGQPPKIDRVREDLVDGAEFDRLLAAHTQHRAGARHDSDALLAGKLFDDRGNRMSQSHVTKGGRRYRYYLSQAMLQGRKEDAGSIVRVPAMEIERRVVEAVRGAGTSSRCEHSIGRPGATLGFDAAASASRSGAFGPAADRSAALERVTIGRTTLEIQLAEGMAGDSSDRILVIPWTPPSPYRRREIIPGGSASARVLHQAPDRPADALVRAMGRHRTAGAGSGSSRTQLIHPAPFRAPRILLVVIGRRSASASASPSRGPGNGILRRASATF